MSAYIVNKSHILFLVQAMTSNTIQQHGLTFRWYHGGEGKQLNYGEDSNAADIANLLWRENIKSVSARYPNESSETLPGPLEHETITARDFRHTFDSINPVQVLKACDCLEYQSCEHDGWIESEAHTILNRLRRDAIHALHGYDDAEWGAPEINRNGIRLSSLARH